MTLWYTILGFLGRGLGCLPSPLYSSYSSFNAFILPTSSWPFILKYWAGPKKKKKSLNDKSADGPEPCEAGVPLGVPETSSLEEDKIRKRKFWEVSTLLSSSPGTWKKLHSKSAGTRNAETTVHRRGTLLPRQMHEGAGPLPRHTSLFLGSQTHSRKPPFPGSE